MQKRVQSLGFRFQLDYIVMEKNMDNGKYF